MKKLLLLIVLLTLNIHYLHTQWVQQTVPVSKPITGIKFIDSLKGWACTSQGSDTAYILNTTNGGTNWLVQLAAYNVNFTDINFLDALTGYVSGADNNIGLYKLFKTSNGGVNWTSVTMVPNMNIADMQFLNKDSAWECGNSIGPDVRTTTDGGSTWIVRTSGITQATQRVFFLDYNTGFCGAMGRLFKTTNRGINWILNNNFTEQVYGIFFKDTNTGWVSLSGHKIGSTSNGGLNWSIQNPFGRSENIYDIYFMGSIGWAASGWAGKILKSTDSGTNWGYQIDLTEVFRMSFVDTMTGWTGAFGISKTTNGGGPITYVGINNISTEIPNSFNLYQNYPNPFNPVTNINFDVKAKSSVRLIVFDILGRVVSELVNETLNAGSYEYNFTANELSSGMYFYKLIANGFSETKKMILIK